MMFLRSLIAILSLVFIQAAQGTTQVWFEAAPFPGFPPSGGPGQALTLLCDSGDPFHVCTWQVSMKATLGMGMYGWDLDLLTAPGNGVSISNSQILPPFTVLPNPGTLGSGPTLLHNAGGETFTVVPTQTLTLMTFTLTKNNFPGGIAIADIWGGSSSAEFFAWANDLGEYEVVQFGANPAAPALPGHYGAVPLIKIVIPEPASLSLLALGAAVCLRRRGWRVNCRLP